MKTLALPAALALTTLAACAETTSGTPPFQTGTVLTWDQAVARLNGGNVVTVSQTHDLWVAFVEADGTSYEAREPTIDAILDEIGACGACGDIAVITE